MKWRWMAAAVSCAWLAGCGTQFLTPEEARVRQLSTLKVYADNRVALRANGNVGWTTSPEHVMAFSLGGLAYNAKDIRSISYRSSGGGEVTVAFWDGSEVSKFTPWEQTDRYVHALPHFLFCTPQKVCDSYAYYLFSNPQKLMDLEGEGYQGIGMHAVDSDYFKGFATRAIFSGSVGSLGYNDRITEEDLKFRHGAVVLQNTPYVQFLTPTEREALPAKIEAGAALMRQKLQEQQRRR